MAQELTNNEQVVLGRVRLRCIPMAQLVQCPGARQNPASDLRDGVGGHMTATTSRKRVLSSCCAAGDDCLGQVGRDRHGPRAPTLPSHKKVPPVGALVDIANLDLSDLHAPQASLGCQPQNESVTWTRVIDTIHQDGIRDGARCPRGTTYAGENRGNIATVVSGVEPPEKPPERAVVGMPRFISPRSCSAPLHQGSGIEFCGRNIGERAGQLEYMVAFGAN